MNHQIFLAVCFSPLTETSQYKADYMKADCINGGKCWCFLKPRSENHQIKVLSTI